MIAAAAPAEKEAILNRAAVKGRSLWDDSRRRLLSNKAAMTGVVVLVLLVVIAVIGPFVWPHKFATQYQDRLAWEPTSNDCARA